MYLPKHFEETRTEVLHQFIQQHPLACVITQSATGLNANHIPLMLLPDTGPYGTLQGHVARANPMLHDLQTDHESLVVFQGHDLYMSPSLYASKQETGKVVPTWNYAVTHAYGRLRIIDDDIWLRGLLDRLTSRNEASQAAPWATTDAPEDFIQAQMRAIVGIELTITRLVGKMKLSQNQPAKNQASIIAGLQERGDPASLAMAGEVFSHARKS
jgi:transcriptional regulator